MQGRLTLHVPRLEEMGYREKIMADPATMSYNKGYDLSFEGYDRETGCIAFEKKDWAEWYGFFIGQEPQRFYAYITRREDGAFIGEVNVHKNGDAPWYEMGIVLEAKYRGQGYATEALRLLTDYAFDVLNAGSIHNDFEDTRTAALQTHLSAGFTVCRRENGIVEVLLTREQHARNRAVQRMTEEIVRVLRENGPSVYLHGSCTTGDFQPGWSDIDLLVLVKEPIAPAAAEQLVSLRQTFLEGEPGNPYYRVFEGGMLTQAAFLSGAEDRVVYWGTSGERIARTYAFNPLSMAEWLENGVLLYGEDIRAQVKAPDFAALYAGIVQHYESIRRCAREPGRSLYAFGWMLDIARCVYTLRTGKIIAKTAAGQWALEKGICPAEDALQTALQVRRSPLELGKDERMLDIAQGLGRDIQRFADVLESELAACAPGEHRAKEKRR